jgi:predicted regulator of Ras-like GTPase activity (Roadblock/LC7/MglB family)
MAATASPYGLRPINRIDGMPYAGATSQFLIDPAGEATNLFYGQVVIIGADGYIALSTATGADLTTNNLGGNNLGAIGVFVGASYINEQGQQIFGQYYPSGTTGVVTAYVVTDDSVTFQAQLDGVADQSDLGANTFFAAVQSTSTGSTRTGNSTSALESATQTAAAAFKIIGFASPVTDAFPDVLVKFNPGAHAFSNAVGI